jgi:transposase-like protein
VVADEADARSCLGAMAVSGMGVSAWARQNGVEPGSLYRWRQLVAGLDGDGIADEVEARRLLAAWARSGRCFAEWCRGEKVSMEALRQWRRRIEASRLGSRRGERSARSATPPVRVPPIRLVEITPTSSVVGPPVHPPPTARYEVQVGRCRVFVGGDFDDAALARILRVAAAC